MPAVGRGAKFGLGPEARLRARREFARVFSDGRKVGGRGAIVWHYTLPASRQRPRLGLSVTAKVGGAVLRARLKRLAREAFRLNRDRLKEGSDVVVCLRPGCRWKSFAEAERQLMELFGKAGLLAR